MIVAYVNCHILCMRRENVIVQISVQLSYKLRWHVQSKSQSYPNKLQNAVINVLMQSEAISRCSHFSRGKRILRTIMVTISPGYFTNFRTMSRNCAWTQYTVICGVARRCRNSFKLVPLAGARYIHLRQAGGQRKERLHGGL